MKINPNDISTAHRGGRKPTNQITDRRSIIAKLCRRDIKKDLMIACRTLKSNMYINESLTPTRTSIMYVLRQAKKKKNRLVGCSSIGGRIFAWLTSEEGEGRRDVRLPINTHLQLQSFCTDILEEPLSNYLQKWQH